jgi:hypothetical protein
MLSDILSLAHQTRLLSILFSFTQKGGGAREAGGDVDA